MAGDKRGRPPADEPRSVQVFVRFSEREAEGIDKMVAEAVDMARAVGAPDPTRSSVIRALVLRALADRDVKPMKKGGKR